MQPMTPQEWSAFLRAGTRTGKLALVLPSGRPTVTPVWFVFEDDGVLRFETDSGAPKARALRKNPQVSLVVDLEEPPYSFVRIDGTAHIVDDPAEVRRVAFATGARYMGEDRAEEFGERNGVPGEIVVEVRPTKVTAFTDITG